MKNILCKLFLVMILIANSFDLNVLALSHTCVTVTNKESAAIMVENSQGEVTYYQDEDCLSHVINNTTESGTVITVLKSATLTEKTTLNENVYLFLPSSMDSTFPLTNGTYKAKNNDLYGDAIQLDEPFINLTLAKGVKFEVNGTMLVDSVSGSNKVNHNFITGAYAKVTTEQNSQIIVNGRLDNFGMITGKGTMTVNSGAVVSDLLTIYRFKGGDEVVNATVLEGVTCYPLNETACGNIHILTTFNYGSQLLGNVKIYLPSDSTFNSATMNIIGSNGLYRSNEGGYITRQVTSYDAQQIELPYVTYEMHKGGQMSCSDLSVKYKSGSLTITAKISSRYFVYPITGNTTIELSDGEYDLDYAFKFLPGSSLYVHDGATLNINTNEENQVNTGAYELKTGIKMNMVGIGEGYTGTDIGEAKGLLVFYSGDTYSQIETNMPSRFRYAASKEDAKLVVEGIVNVNNGILMGDNISVKGNGQIIIPDENEYYQIDDYELIVSHELTEITGLSTNSGGTVAPTTSVMFSTNYTDLGINLTHQKTEVVKQLENNSDYHLVGCNGCDSFVKEAHQYAQWETVKNPTYTTQGEKQRQCNECGFIQTETIDCLVDEKQPTLEVLIDEIAVEDHFYTTRKSVNLQINAVDEESGVEEVLYALSNTKIADLSSVSWNQYDDSINLELNANETYIYIKAIDVACNESEIEEIIINLEEENPVAIINGMLLVNGYSSCDTIKVEISETNLESVEVNGEVVTVSDNQFVLPYSDSVSSYTITITNKNGEKTSIENIVLGHHLEKYTEYIEPTCVTKGQKETYQCQDCEMIFEDSEGKTKLTNGLELPINPDCHKSQDTISQDATYCKEGYTNRVICTDCHTVLDEGTIIPKVEMTSISFETNDVNLAVGQQMTLSLNCEPIPYTKGDIIWSSSNEDVLIVEEGVITGLSEGTVVVSALSPNHLYASCTITVSYLNPYDDVAYDLWYTEPILRATSLGLMTGKTSTHFGTNELLSRAATAMILYRMQGEPEVSSNNPANEKFPDVANTWYTDAITWANETGVVTGHLDTGLFKPNDGVTRQQLALMLYRYAKNVLGEDVSNKADLTSYPDSNEIASWAKEAMEWAVAEGIIQGNDATQTLNPTGTAKRSECAVMMMRFYDQFID